MVSGAVEDANEYFNDITVQHIQKQYSSESNSLNSSNGSEFNNISSNMSVTSADSIPRQSKQFLVNNAREIPSVPPSVTTAKVPASNRGTSKFSQFNTTPAATQVDTIFKSLVLDTYQCSISRMKLGNHLAVFEKYQFL